MANILDIHGFLISDIRKRLTIEPVALKHPLPERPRRALGLVHIDGDVYSSKKLSRAVFLRIKLPVYFKVRSMFLRPKMEYDLPVFACEVMKTGKKTMIIVDIHRTGANTGHDDEDLFDQMIEIRDKYTDLNKRAITQKSEIQGVFSRAACQARYTEDMDDQAIGICRDYLGVFLDMMEQTEKAKGESLSNVTQAYEKYLETLVDHDPGVKAFKMFFGKEGGIERSMNMHFNR